MSIIKKNFLVASDYNWLPQNIEESWVHKYTKNYLIYDRFHRYKESDKIKWQNNVGQNVYDIFYFIAKNYDNLPEATIFCRSCLMFPKYDKKPLSHGNISEENFLKLVNNENFTEVHDSIGPEFHKKGNSFVSKILNLIRVGKFQPSSKADVDGGFLELNNSWYFRHFKGKYFNNLNDFLNEVYVSPVIPEYIRFSPGANYIIPKKNMLRYSKNFYEKMCEYVGWDVLVAEAHMFERLLYTIFTCDWEVKDKYK